MRLPTGRRQGARGAREALGEVLPGQRGPWPAASRSSGPRGPRNMQECREEVSNQGEGLAPCLSSA